MTRQTSPTSGFLIDMDGLLINSEAIAFDVFSELCALNGGIFTRDIHSAILGSESDYWSTYIVSQCRLGIDPLDFQKIFYQMFREKLDQDIALMPGAKELLEWIDLKGYKKCLVTSSGSEIAKRNLQLLGLQDHFVYRVTAEMSPNGKPDPGPYLMGASVIGCDPANCIVFEDSMNGTLSGSRAGCRVVAVPTEFARPDGFSKADYVLRSLLEAVSLLESLHLS